MKKGQRSLLGVVRELFGLLDAHQRRNFSLLGALSAVNAVMEAISAGFVFALVNSVTASSTTGGGPIGSVLRTLAGPDASASTITILIAATTLVFYLVKNVSSVIELYLQQRLVHQAAADASSDIVARYLRVPMAYHYLQRSGDVLRDSWTASETVYRTSMLAALSILSEGLAAVALLTVLLVAAPTITPVVIVMLAVLVIGMYRFLRPRMTQWGQELNELASSSLHGIQEAFGALRDARIQTREGYFADRYRRDRDELARSFWKSGTAVNSSRFVLETAFIITMVVIVLLINARGDGGAKTVTVLGLYGYAGLRLMPSANRVIAALGGLRLGDASVDLVRKALDVPTEPVPVGDAKLPFAERLEVRGVTYSFAGATTPAVDDVTLVVPKGETLGIVGPSGGGKSTLVDLLVGLLVPDQGSVEVDGVDIRTNLPGWRRQIGYVSQAVFLLDATIRANVAFGIPADEVDEAALWSALDQAQLGELVRGLPAGLDTPLGERGVRLSGGQRQRVAVARALYHSPEVLVFDEATAALDTQTEEGLTAAIEVLSETRTVVIVAHRLSTVRRCDRLVFMDHGRAVDTGTFEQLTARNDAFANLVRAGQL